MATLPENIQPVDLERSITANIKKGPRELAQLARKSIDAGKRHGRLMLDEYLRAGRYLHALKRRVGHGSWLPHLEAEGINERHAQRLMVLAKGDRAVIAYVEALDPNEEPSLRGALAAVENQHRQESYDSVQHLESDELPEDEGERAGKAKNVTPKRKRAAHPKYMNQAARLIADLRAAMYEGEPIAGVIGFLQGELREIDFQLKQAIDVQTDNEAS